MAALAGQVGYRFVDLANSTIDGSAAMLIPEAVARRYRAIPIAFDGRSSGNFVMPLLCLAR